MAQDRKKGLLTLLRIGLSVAVLAFVASRLPWHDQLVWQDASGAQHSVPGDIEGDWKGERVRFRPAPEASAPEAWAPESRERWRAGETLELERGAALHGAATLDWKPGMPRAFASMEAGWLARGTGLLFLSLLIVITRWWRLLALASCPTSWFNALRLSFIGTFFNLVVPGLTGGDVIKAILVARENPRHRPDALVSVVVDRILGIIALAVLAAGVILVAGEEFRELRLPLIGFLVLGVVAVVAYVGPGLRRKLALGKLVDRLPFGDKLRALDRAALVYVRHPLELALAFTLSFLNHVVIVLAVACLGRAAGVDADTVGLREYFVVVPVANMVSSVPLAPGGWGVGEAAYGVLFKMMGADATLGVAISVVFRLIMLAFGLVGGLFLLVPGAQRAVRLAEAEAQRDRADAPLPEAPA